LAEWSFLSSGLKFSRLFEGRRSLTCQFQLREKMPRARLTADESTESNFPKKFFSVGTIISYSSLALAFMIWMSMILPVRFVNQDDMYVIIDSQSWHFLWAHIQDFVTLTGRLSHVLFGILSSVPYLSRQEYYFEFAKAVGLILMLFGFVAFTATFTRSLKFALATIAVFIGTAEVNWDYNPLVSYPFIFTFQLFCLFSSFALYVRGLRSSHPRHYFIASALMYFLCCASYESYLPLIVCYPALAAFEYSSKGKFSAKNVLVSLKYHGAFWLIWVVCYVLYRELVGAKQYSGITISLASPQKLLTTFASYFLSAFPGAASIMRPDQLFHSFSAFQEGIKAVPFDSISHVSFFLFILVASLSFAISAKPDNPKGVFYFGIFAAILAFPLIAISSKYQENMESIKYAYYVPSLQAAFTLSLSLCALPHLVSRWNRFVAMSVQAFVIIFLSLAMISVQTYNKMILSDMTTSTKKWLLLDRIMSQGSEDILRKARTMFIPQLYRQLGVAHADPDYWSTYIESLYGYKMKIIVDEQYLQEAIYPTLFILTSDDKSGYEVVLMKNSTASTDTPRPLEFFKIR
jgi:hypothetical protein